MPAIESTVEDVLAILHQVAELLSESAIAGALNPLDGDKGHGVPMVRYTSTLGPSISRHHDQFLNG